MAKKISELRKITEYIPLYDSPVKHPTYTEMMDKLNEVIRAYNFLVENYMEAKK